MTERMIVEDPLGRIVSVPANAIPRGSKIIRPDVEPGLAENTAQRNVSEVVNPVDVEIEQTPDGAFVNEDGERVNEEGVLLGEDLRPLDPVVEAESNPDVETDDSPSKTSTRRKK